MDNLTFVDDENIPLVHQDEEDYDERYDTPDTSWVEDETSFNDTTEPTAALRLRQKLTRDKIVSLYRYLGGTGDPGLADLDQFMIKKNSKTGNIELLFLDGNNQWQSLTNKRTGEFLSAKTLREKIGGINAMKNFLGIDKAPPILERSLRAASSRQTCRWRVYPWKIFHP